MHIICVDGQRHIVSDHCKNITNKYNISIGKIKKLGIKCKYIHHYQNLHLYQP